MRVQLVDPPAYTPPYDYSLASALARAGAEVELLTSRYPYGPAPAAQGFAVREAFYARTMASDRGTACAARAAAGRARPRDAGPPRPRPGRRGPLSVADAGGPGLAHAGPRRAARVHLPQRPAPQARAH
ncbi:MAG: hypothetical protein WKF40_05315 [Thermoleophilaceae bacterium]